MAYEVPGQFEKLDKVSFGWLHVKAILVAGIGYETYIKKFKKK